MLCIVGTEIKSSNLPVVIFKERYMTDKVLYFSTDLEFYHTRSSYKYMPLFPLQSFSFTHLHCVFYPPWHLPFISVSVYYTLAPNCGDSSAFHTTGWLYSMHSVLFYPEESGSIHWHFCAMLHSIAFQKTVVGTLPWESRCVENFLFNIEELQAFLTSKKFVVDILSSVISVQCVGIFIVLSVFFH